MPITITLSDAEITTSVFALERYLAYIRQEYDAAVEVGDPGAEKWRQRRDVILALIRKTKGESA